jgi:sugar-specific transcriptional regulator TrmB
VYAALRRLVDDGAARVLTSAKGEPERFAATPARAFLALLRKRFEASSRAVEEAARRLDVASEEPDAYSVKGYDGVLHEAQRLITLAKKRLLVSGWPRELAGLRAELMRADRRGVDIVVFGHARPPEGTPGEVFTYGLLEGGLEEFWKHRLVLVCDDRFTLVGATEQGPDDGAVITTTPAIAELATSQITLDVTLLAQRTGQSVEQTMARILGHRVGRLDELLRTSKDPQKTGTRRGGRPG